MSAVQGSGSHLGWMPPPWLLREDGHSPVQLWPKLVPREAAESSPCSKGHVRFQGGDSEEKTASTSQRWLPADWADAELVAKTSKILLTGVLFLSVLWTCIFERAWSAWKPGLLLYYSPSHDKWSGFGSQVVPLLWAGDGLGLVLVICRQCNQTSIVVQAPEILVHSCMVPTSTHLTPLRFLFFLGIFIYIMLIGGRCLNFSFWREILPHHIHPMSVAGAFS